MSSPARLHRGEPKELQTLFLDDGKDPMHEDEREPKLQELAIKIARTGARGVDFLVSCISQADELRLRAILLAFSFVAKKLSSRKRASICELASKLLHDNRPLVVAEAVDTMSSLGCQAASDSILPLLKHSSPYVVGSALRYFARCNPQKALPLLEKALRDKEPIVRQNAVDELDEMDYTPALPKIKRLLHDPDDDVRQAAQTAVAHLENRSA